MRVTGTEGQAANGNDKEEGDEVTDCPKARATSSRPAPCSYTESPSSKVEAIKAAFSSAARQDGCACFSNATAPVTCGVAIEVPEADV